MNLTKEKMFFLCNYFCLFREYGVLNRYKIVASLGLLLEISNSENIHKFVFIDDVISAAQ